MIFILTSIAFFLVVLRVLLFWVYLWQRNEYQYRLLIADIREHSLRRVLPYISYGALFMLLILLYGFVIFYDSVTLWYHGLIALFFITALLRLWYCYTHDTTKNPILSLKALLICIVTLFIVSLLYTTALVDRYLWLIILLLFVPFLVWTCVALLAFPSELYEDYITVKAKEKLIGNKTIRCIALQGDMASFMKTWITAMCEDEKNILVLQESMYLPIAKAIKQHLSHYIDTVVVQLPKRNEDREKLFQLIKPTMLVATSELTKPMVQELLHAVSKNSTILSQKENKELAHTVRKTQKKLLLYGVQTSARRSIFSLFAYNLKKRKNGLSFVVKLGKEEAVMRALPIAEENILFLLPVMYIARICGVSMAKMYKTLKDA